MRNTKMMATVAFSVMIMLIALVIFTDNSEHALYSKTMKTIMAKKGFISLQEVEHHYPELVAIKHQIKYLGDLNKYLISLTGGPAPNVSEADGQEILRITNEIHLLRTNIKIALKQLQ